MLFQRFYNKQLAQASYLVGCQATGEAIVVDPTRDVEPYIAAARAEGVRVTHVTETHVHADFVSGARELARRAGAELLLSGEGGAEWAYGYADTEGARLLRDGDQVVVGRVRLDVLHTPGHTPEHLSFVVTDAGSASAAGAGPMGVLSGDFVFVGDVGRPDLLERAAGHAGTMEAGARALFRSLERFRRLPDHLQLWPGHGAGSACGKALGAVPSSTVGYERLTNWAVAEVDEAAFVRQVLEGQPDPPTYFAQMKRVNRDGPAVLGGLPRPARLPAAALGAVLEGAARAGGAPGTLVVDARPARAFAAGHVPGTVNVPLGKGFATWVGWLARYDRPVYLVVDDANPDHANPDHANPDHANPDHAGPDHVGPDGAEAADAAARDLALIGLDQVAGVFGRDALAWWAAVHGPLATVAQVDVHEVAHVAARGGAAVLDVRGAAEYAAGHVPGAANIPVGSLFDRAGELPRGAPLVVHCQSGVRSAIGASVLGAMGFRNVRDMGAGFAGWQRAGLPVARPGAGVA